ncbi:MAG TPA: UvrD-helicase domain-containing protein, partial [Planctomycetota bacterium]|nr:UvrD-helicase domain-containing protein [Planctomycetota bacterium]
MSPFRPADEEARERARRDHATSLVLEAGAGTGKTTLLVDRIEAIVRSGAARLEEIAAVTFTENAATTMKLRLRERLERARADAAVPEAERRRAALALDVLERAQVSTIHALCAAILAERPLECGVVPGFRTADEAETDLLFSAAWEEWLAERLVAGDDVLLEALDREIPLEGEG